MVIIKFLLDLSKDYPIVSNLLSGLAFGLALFFGLLFIYKQIKKLFTEFKTDLMLDYDRRFGYMEKDIKETQELGRTFRERKEGCDKVQAAVPIIEDLTKKVEIESYNMLKQLKIDLEKMFIDFTEKFKQSDKTEQQIEDIKRIIAGHN